MNDDISSSGWVSNPSKKAFDRLHCIFHFGTENGKDQLKKLSTNTTGRAEVAKYLGGQGEEVVGWQISG